jgi:regulator of chromosome condensation
MTDNYQFPDNFNPELLDPETLKSVTRFHAVVFPEVLVGWKIRVDGREGAVLSCRRRFARATIFDVSFKDQAFTEEVILNRKNYTGKRNYRNYELIEKLF